MDDRQPWRWEHFQDGEFVRKLLIALGIIALLLLFWQLSDVLLLAFGAVLVAVILHAFADVLVQYIRIPDRWGLTAASLIIFAVLLGMAVLFGAQMRGQIANVAERLPLAIDAFSKQLGVGEITGELPQMLGMGPGGGFVSRMAGIGGVILGGLADFFLVVIAGLYIAGSPRVYRRGLVKLFPKSQHDRVEGSLDAAGQALKL